MYNAYAVILVFGDMADQQRRTGNVADCEEATLMVRIALGVYLLIAKRARCTYTYLCSPEVRLLWPLVRVMISSQNKIEKKNNTKLVYSCDAIND